MKHQIPARSIFCAALFSGALPVAAQTEWLEHLDDSLHLQSSSGFVRSDLSGLLDLEGYCVDQRPPGLLFNSDKFFFNPRLSLFLDTRIGPHFYSLIQGRVDRGFDPGGRVRDARMDEYLLRYTPFDDARLNLQAGKFATVVGNWVDRHDSWSNPFINAPVPYENVIPITDQKAPAGPAAFLSRQNLPDNKTAWLTMLWGPEYSSGASVLGQAGGFDYAAEFKNAALSSRPSVWDGTDLGWDNPTVGGRLGYSPNASWNIGASASYGPYMLPAAAGTLPPGTSLGDFNQITVGQDISFAWHHWQVWAEAYATRFQVPNVGNADTLAYYIEVKYKITAGLFAAVRWNQQFFGEVPNGLGGQQPWDHDLDRVDLALGYRFNRHLQGKLQYSFNHNNGPLQQGEQLAAAQLTLKF